MFKLIARGSLGVGLRAAMCVCCTLPAAAQDQAGSPAPIVLTLGEAASLLRIEPEELNRLAEEHEVPARLVGTVWRFNRDSLLTWLNGDWQRAGTTLTRDTRLSPRELQQVAGAGLQPIQAPPQAAAPPPPGDGNKPIGEAPTEKTAEDIFLRGRRVLLGRGDLVVDVGQFYSRGDDLQLAAGIQGLGLATVRQQAWTSLILGRVGIFNETELFASTTFNSVTSRLLFGSETLASGSQSRIDGVTIGVNRTLLRERAGRPDVIGNLAVFIPGHDTGYAISGGAALVKSVDPAVIFANAAYTDWIGTRTASGVTLLEPAATLGVSVGYGLALNDSMAISTTFSGLFTGQTVLDGVSQQRNQLFNGRFALTSRLTRRLYIEPSVSFGISGPSDTVAFGVTVPYSF